MVRQLTEMDPFGFWALLGLLAGLALGALYFAFRQLHRARLIEDTPTSRIRSAHQGYVELMGTAAMMPGDPIIAPLSGMPCCWWRFSVAKKYDKGWKMTRSGVSNSLFLLRDETGECVIDPEEAQVTPSEKSVWYGNSASPSLKPGNDSAPASLFALNSASHSAFGGDYRYTEETIISGDPLYAIGLFTSVGEIDHKNMREESIRQRLREWKSDHAALLKRFDRNRDGRIDLDEWELARRSARSEVTREQLREAPQTAIHTLSSAGSQGRPLLISTQEEFDIVRRFRRWSLASLAGFFLLGGFAVWIATLRLL